MLVSTRRFLAGAAFALAGLAAPSMAQVVQLVEVPDGTMMAPWNMTVEGAKDLNIYGANGQKIGEVDEVIGTSPATPTALVVDFEDGAGFQNADDVAIPLDRFSMASQGLILTASAAEIAAMPTWDD